jgi:cob(I)alamin adenosyltransferase
MISSSRVVIAATSAATTPRTLSSLAAASALVVSSTPRLHLLKAVTTTSINHHRHCYSSGGQHYGQDIVLDLQRSNNIRPNQSSCDMSQSIPPPSSDCNEGQISTATASSASSIDIEDIHRHAILNHQTTYIDPITNYTVFTELAHLKRGICCGNVCRHCPYGYINVRRPIPIDDTTTQRRNMPRAVSGDQIMTSRLVDRIMNGTYYNENEEENDEENEEASSTADANKSTSSTTTTTLSQSIATSNKQSTILVGSGKGGYDGGTFTNKNVPYTRKGDTGTAQLFTGECRSKDDALFDALGTVDELCSLVGLVHDHLTTTTTITAEAETAESSSNNNKYGELPNQLLDVMSRLFDVGSHIAKPTPPQQLQSTHNATTSSNSNNNYSGYDFSHSTTILEEWIDNMTNELPELLSFIIPTGSIISSQLHVARTVCRRAERCMVPLVIAAAKSQHLKDDDDDDDDDNEKNKRTIDPDALAYVNRLSDYFFTAARYVNYCDGIDEVQYRAIGEESRRSNVNTPTSTTTTHRERVVVKLKK